MEKELDEFREDISSFFVFKDNKIVFSHGDQDALFSVASITKQFTAFLVLRETNKRKISLSTPISTFVKQLPAWGEKVTLAHLLTHSSGVKSRKDPLAFEPGTQTEYSATVGYGLLADAVANIAGKPYEVLMKDLLKEVGMDSSGLRVSSYIDENIIHYPKMTPSKTATKFGGPEETNYQDWQGAGGLITSAKDLSIWWNFLKKHPIFKQMNQIQVQIAIMNDFVEYGFGMARVDDVIFHFGSNAGYLSVIYYLPCSNTLLIALSDHNTPILKTKYDKLIKILKRI
jgi:CubicO group peptidase (beta-lactamase class C family)